MFVFRNIVNHELMTDDVNVDGEYMHGVAGFLKDEDAQTELHTIIADKVGKYFVEDWDIIQVDDKLYYEINEHLENDSDYKAFYFNNGSYEILNTRTGKLIRHDKE